MTGCSFSFSPEFQKKKILIHITANMFITLCFTLHLKLLQAMPFNHFLTKIKDCFFFSQHHTLHNIILGLKIVLHSQKTLLTEPLDMDISIFHSQYLNFPCDTLNYYSRCFQHIVVLTTVKHLAMELNVCPSGSCFQCVCITLRDKKAG